jgi:hypothetical protein
VGEKPRSLQTIGVIGTPDLKAASIAADAANALCRIEPKIASIGTEFARTAQGLLATQVAESVGGSLRNMTAPLVGEALQGIRSARLAQTGALAETLKASLPTQTFNIARTIDLPVITPKVADALRPSIAEALDSFAVPAAFTVGVNETLKNLASMPRFEIAPQFSITVREAAAIAESPAVREQVGEMLIGLEDLTPVERRELQKDVAFMVAAILSLVAYLASDDRVALASACLMLAASLISIYWRVAGRPD